MKKLNKYFYVILLLFGFCYFSFAGLFTRNVSRVISKCEQLMAGNKTGDQLEKRNIDDIYGLGAQLARHFLLEARSDEQMRRLFEQGKFGELSLEDFEKILSEFRSNKKYKNRLDYINKN